MICKKTSYSTENFANEDLKRLQTSKRNNIPTRSYLCDKCNTWHLTSDNKVLFDKIEVLEIALKNLKFQKVRGDVRVERIKHTKEIQKLKEKHKLAIDKLNEKYKNLESVLTEIRKDYQPIKTKIHNGTNKRGKRNGR